MTNTNEITLEKEENKMGVMPIPKLLITMSLPMMISMLIQALYNIVDSMFVAQLSENALTAVSLAFPIQSLMIAIAAGTGVGINALLSRNLGEKDFTLSLIHICISFVPPTAGLLIAGEAVRDILGIS